MSLKIIFLGTSGGVPTNERSLPSVVIQREGEILMFDCGEGTQRQMIKAKLGFGRRMTVFITHMHGDHVLGLPGLIQTMSLLGREKPLNVYGPTGIKAFIEAVTATVKFWLSFPINVTEVSCEGTVYECGDYEVKAVWADHTIPSLAYALVEKPRPGRFYPERAMALGVPMGPLWSALQRGASVTLPDGRVVKPSDVLGPPRPGRKIAYSGDTRPSDRVVELAKDADVLIHEATFGDDLQERAKEEGHSTSSGAANVASKANVNLLILTHISARYSHPEVLLEEARRIFPNTRLASDLDEIEVPLPNQ